jgi:PAS domain S-box-containing protein
VDYVTKPIQHEEVLARVSTHLRIRELTRSLEAQADEIRTLNERLNAENIQVKADLEKSEQKYNTLVEEITDGYVVIQDERIVFANRAFCEMHGYQTGDVAGQEFLRFIAPENPNRIVKFTARSDQEEPTSQLVEYMRLTQDGRSLPTEMTMKPILYEGRPTYIGICRDTAERIEMERKIREAERLADIGKITTSLSHEIRNPLSATKMNLQILTKSDQLADDDRPHLELALDEVIRLEGMLSELLDFARPLFLKKSSCQINNILTANMKLLAVKFEQKDVSIVSSFDPDIPEFQADGEKLSRASINLLLNALEVSEEGGTIWVTSRYVSDTQPPGVEVAIEDEGPGIPQEQASDIFKPFFTTKTKGTGLGLTNVKHTIEAHEGRVDVSNRPSGGAAFRVWLPVE